MISTDIITLLLDVDSLNNSPAKVGHLSAVNGVHKLSGLYGVSFAYRIPSSPCDKTANRKQSFSEWFILATTNKDIF